MPDEKQKTVQESKNSLNLLGSPANQGIEDVTEGTSVTLEVNA